MANILILYYSRNGSTLELARQVCRGVESVAGASALLRTVPPVTSAVQPPIEAVPAEGPPYVTPEEWASADGIALGSPTRFGTMAAPMKYFLDGTSASWVSGALVGRPLPFIFGEFGGPGGDFLNPADQLSLLQPDSVGPVKAPVPP